jgi:hypothetical protein
MEAIGIAGNAVMAFGMLLMVAGLGEMILFLRDDARRTRGLRVVLAGMATVSVGAAIFLVSRPDTILPFPLNFAFGLVFVLIALRLAVRAAILRHPGKT